MSLWHKTDWALPNTCTRRSISRHGNNKFISLCLPLKPMVKWFMARKASQVSPWHICLCCKIQTGRWDIPMLHKANMTHRIIPL